MNICLFTHEEIDKPLKADDERAVHIKRILHKGVGDTFSAGIIGGQAGTATITSIGGADANLSQAKDAGDIVFTFSPQSDGKPLFPLQMIIGFPRPIQLKRLLRDMAALGVQSVRLCGTELGEKSYLKAGLSDPKEIYKMLLDGTVQAASTHVPQPYVYPSLAACLDALDAEADASPRNAAPALNADPLSLSGLTRLPARESGQVDKFPIATWRLAALQSFGQTILPPLKLALDNVDPQSSLTSYLNQNPPQGRSALAAIGSERGWSPTERALLESRGFVRLGMGNRVMRTETASTVSASLILSAMGALG